MSREWFQIARRPLGKPHGNTLADPLEGEEWRGLGWAVPLLSRLAQTRSPASKSSQQHTLCVPAGRSRHPANA